MFASCSEPVATRKRRGRKGVVLLAAAALVLLILVPAIGLSIDVGVMYLVQLRLAAASDAAALAGARALARGTDDQAQRTNAETTADTYFHANFPSGYFSSRNEHVTNVAATDSASMRSITTNSSVDVPFLFMRVFGMDHISLRASAKSTRRDVNIMIVMDRSTSLQLSGACAPLKAAAVNFVEKFSEGRDYMGLVTFATGSRLDVDLTQTFKTTVKTTLNSLVCDGYTNSSQGLWQSYQALAGLAQTGALNVIVFFTDGHPTGITESFPIKGASPCATHTDKIGVLTGMSSTQGLYRWSAPAQPLASDQRVLDTPSGCCTSCRFVTNGLGSVTTDVQYAPLTDYWGNSLTPPNAYYTGLPTNGSGLSIASAANVEKFSTNAADHAGLRIRRGDPDPMNGNRTLADVTIFSIGLGDVDEVFLKRVANDPSLSPNPVAAGKQGRYYYAANATDLDQAFTRVASEMLRLAR